MLPERSPHSNNSFSKNLVFSGISKSSSEGCREIPQGSLLCCVDASCACDLLASRLSICPPAIEHRAHQYNRLFGSCHMVALGMTRITTHHRIPVLGLYRHYKTDAAQPNYTTPWEAVSKKRQIGDFEHKSYRAESWQHLRMGHLAPQSYRVQQAGHLSRWHLEWALRASQGTFIGNAHGSVMWASQQKGECCSCTVS